MDNTFGLCRRKFDKDTDAPTGIYTTGSGYRYGENSTQDQFSI